MAYTLTQAQAFLDADGQIERQQLAQVLGIHAVAAQGVNDFIFLATHEAINFETAKLAAKNYDWLKERLLRVDQTQGVVLTDNLSQLERLQIRKSEHYRRMIVDSLGMNHFVR